MNFLMKFMPFWKSKDIGIISKVCLTYTAIIMGLIMGVLEIFIGLASFLEFITNKSIYSPSGITLIFIIGITYIISGISFIFHYIYVRRGFNLKSSVFIRKSYIMFFIGYSLYDYTKQGSIIGALIGGIIVSIIFGIPLIKAKKAFNYHVKLSEINE